MKSMTGYGQASGETELHRVSVSIRTVNGRFLDCSVRLKDDYRLLETPIRQLVEQRLSRGRVDVSVEIQPLTPRPARVEVQMEIVHALHSASHELAAKGLVATELGLADLLRLPEVVEIRVDGDELEAAEADHVLGIVNGALDEVIAARSAEGGQLQEILAQRVAELVTVADALTTRVEEVTAALHENLTRRVADLLGDVGLDDARMAQEVAILVDKADVSEELDRLGAHLEHFAEVASTDGPIGKRLDFLTQELLRELNTLGSKGRHADVTRLVLDGKVICEQLREQLQNVE